MDGVLQTLNPKPPNLFHDAVILDAGFGYRFWGGGGGGLCLNVGIEGVERSPTTPWTYICRDLSPAQYLIC